MSRDAEAMPQFNASAETLARIAALWAAQSAANTPDEDKRDGAALAMSPAERAASARVGVWVTQHELQTFAGALARRKTIDESKLGVALRAIIRGQQITDTSIDAAMVCLDIADRIGRKFPDGRLESFSYLRPGFDANGINPEAFAARIADAQAKAILRDQRDRQASERRRAVGLVDDESGKPKNCLSNVLTVLATDSKWTDVVRYNALSCRPVICGEPPIDAEIGEDWTDTHTTRFRAWLQANYDFEPSREHADAAIDEAAHRNEFHPVADYLRGLVWDGQPRIDHLFGFYFGAYSELSGASAEEAARGVEYLKMVSGKWMISAARRALIPGCKVDTMPILEGKQNTGKSTGVKILAVQDEWFSDTKLDIENKDGVQSLFGKWLIEVGEFAGMRRADVDSLKRFVSAQSDYIRVSFGKRNQDYPRNCAFVATINPDGSGYLTDTTGNRRFWPVKCGLVNLERLRQDVAQLWAEATHRALGGEPHWLTAPAQGELASAEQEEREASDPWLEKIEAWLRFDGNVPDGSFALSSLQDSLVEKERQTATTTARISKLLRVLGWSSRKVRVGSRSDNQTRRIWTRALG